jgi:hypothetical protein
MNGVFNVAPNQQSQRRSDPRLYRRDGLRMLADVFVDLFLNSDATRDTCRIPDSTDLS